MYRKLYWVDDSSDNGKIRRANLDGSQAETIITGLENPEGLDIDEGAGKIYWAEWGRIGRANLDGSQVETIGSVWGADIALDVDGGKAYLAYASFFDNRIYRTGLNGSPVETLFSVSARGIALDKGGGKIYWTERDGVMRANFDGSGRETLIRINSDAPHDITLGP